ncbi:MAG: IS4 family transposase [Gammaproteobacteria bacterium]|nr:IS4 family transposase [Gammaproteobacteria bacterium]
MAAFCKARLKFSFSAFSDLNAILTNDLYQSAFAQKWNGFRLLAVDGSTLELPQKAALFDHFGKMNPQANYPSARLSQLYDVINKISIDIQVSPIKVGERNLASRHLKCANKHDLVLYDRGYPAFWLFALHQHHNVQYCARMPIGFSTTIKAFVESKEKDRVIELSATKKSIKKCQALDVSTSNIKVRLIRVMLDDGSIEVLATSLLDTKKFPRKTFLNLYHQRWFVEEDYKIMKSRLEIENFSGFSVEAILQDIHAKALTKNIAAVAILEADVLAKEKYLHRKHKYQINFSYTLSQFKDNIIRFVLCLIPLRQNVEFIERLSKAVDAVRPGRKFKRNTDNINPKKYSTGYKRVI